MAVYVLCDEGVESKNKFLKRNIETSNIQIVDKFNPKLVNRVHSLEHNLISPHVVISDAQMADILSHILQWSACLEERQPRTILDCAASFPPNFIEEHQEMMASIKKPWDIIIWGVDYNGLITANMPHNMGECIIKIDDHLSVCPEKPSDIHEISPTFLHLSRIKGGAAYSISPQGAAKLLGTLPVKEYSYVNKFLEGTQSGVDVDCLFSSLMEAGQLSAYIAFPPPIVGRLPEDIFSTIGEREDAFDYARPDMKAILDDCVAQAHYPPISPVEAGDFPKIIHFVETSMASQPIGEAGYFLGNGPAGMRPFGFAHYMAVRSAMVAHPDYRVMVWCVGERAGPYWDAIKALAEIVIIPDPQRIFGNPALHPAHKADIIRMCVLRLYGGIYLDLDTITTRHLGPLCSSVKTVMAAEVQSTEPKIISNRLGNAVIFTPLNALFMNIWWESYKKFDSRKWGESSLYTPYLISQIKRECIDVIDPEYCLFPLGDAVGLHQLFEEYKVFPKSFIFHLWESASWGMLKEINEVSIWERSDTYSMACRTYLDEPERQRLEHIKRTYRVFDEDENEVSTEPLSRIFRKIYETNMWGGQGDVYPGPGSDPGVCSDYVKFMADYIARYEVTSLMDVGCGDFKIGARLAEMYQSVQFIATDIVNGVIVKNRKKYSYLQNVEFYTSDITNEILDRKCDLVVVKHVFQHLSNASIIKALSHLQAAKEVLIINHIVPQNASVNEDIADGPHMRAGRLDFSCAPFGLQVEVLATLPIKGAAGYMEVVRYRLSLH